MTPSSSDLTGLSLAEAARRLRARGVSPVDLTRACLERIERLDPGLNAFIAVTAETALAEARRAENELARGEARGPLHGIPVAVKDLVDVAGVPTTGASAAFLDHVPERDAEVTARLRAGGAVLLGKLNLHELAYGASSVVGHFGMVRNPWAPGRTAGGSSAGAAVALACGLCYGAVGTDTGGSIRQPASFCGIVGLKPTFGRVSVRGVLPLAHSYDHVGPMTRSAEDAALMLGVMCDGGDAAIDPSIDARRLRIGVAREHFFAELDPEVARALEGALAVLGGLASAPREVSIPALTDTTIFRAEAWEQHGELALRHPELLQPETLRRVLAGREVDPVALAEARATLAGLRKAARELFANVDVVVTPTTPSPAFAVEEPPAETPDLRALELVSLRNTRPFNALGAPAISIPCGFTADGRPIGMQLAGAPGAEASVLALAQAYQGATEWHSRRPAVD
jgi:aspartyl-tRNA(Asn)/glutamyl-tRNA(Gln) amidotransferase subunit A